MPTHTNSSSCPTGSTPSPVLHTATGDGLVWRHTTATGPALRFTPARNYWLYGALALLVHCAPAELAAQDAGPPASRISYTEINRLIDHGVYGEAARRLEEYLQNNANDLEARRLLATTYALTDDEYKLYQQAQIILLEAPNDAQALQWRDQSRQSIDQTFPQVVAELRDALKRDPQNLAARRQLIDVLVQHGNLSEATAEFRTLLEQSPDQPELVLQYARMLSWAEHYEESIRQYRNYLQDNDSPQARLELAKAMAWNAQPGPAAQLLQELIDENPNNLEAKVTLGDLYRWNDDTDVALAMYEQVLAADAEHSGALSGIQELKNLRELRAQQAERLDLDAMLQRVRQNPQDTDSLLQLARLYGAAGRYPQAEEQFARYLALKPEDAPVRREYALALSVQEKYDAAIAQLENYLQTHPEDLAVRNQIINILMWQSKYEEAEAALLAYLEITPNRIEAHWNLGRIYEMNLDWDKALQHYRQIIELDPTYLAPQLQIQQVQNHPGYRIQTLQRRIEADPQDITPRLDLANLLLKLNRYFEARTQAEGALSLQGSNAEAQRILNEADGAIKRMRLELVRDLRQQLRKNPENSKARLELAKLLQAESRYEEALAHYRVYLRQQPEDPEARMQYAQVLSWLSEHQDEALVQLNELSLLYSEDKALRLQRLEVMSRIKGNERQVEQEIRQMRSEARQMLLLDPEDPGALLKLGQLAQLQQDYPQALDYFQQTLAADPDNAQAEAYIAAILSLPDYRIAQLDNQIAATPQSLDLRLAKMRMLYDLERWFEAREAAKAVLQIEKQNREALRVERIATDIIERERGENLRALRKAVREEPSNLSKQLQLGQLLKADGSYPEAVRRYQLYLRENPYDVPVRREYAELLSWMTENYDEALHEYRGLVEYYPDDLGLRIEFARQLTYSREHWDEAKAELDDLILLAPENLEVPLLLADLYRFQGRYPEARELYRQVMAQSTPPAGRPRNFAELRARPGLLPPLSQGAITVLPGLEANYKQAYEGLTAISDELRPQVMGFIGYMADNDKYTEFQIGARYFHFLESGTRLHIGLTGYRFTESTADPSRVRGLNLSLGATGRITEEIVGDAEIGVTHYEPLGKTTVSGLLRGTYQVTPNYNASLEYAKYDAVQEIKTVQSLEAGVDVDRVAFAWTSTPSYPVQDEPFLRRVFVDARFSYAGFSDGNRQTTYFVRPYYRFRDNPTLDLSVGWRGLSYSKRTPLYWSPDNYNGPFVQLRLAGEMFWDILYDLRVELLIPNESGGPARGVSAYFQREFLKDFFGGLSLSFSENPREDNFLYRYGMVMFDLRYTF